MRGDSFRPAAILRLALATLLLASSAAFANPGTTTLGTRGSASQPNPPITSNAGAHWSNYSRPAQYARAVTLPLQFIDTRSGDKLAVLVSVPADANGNPVPGKFPAILTQTAYRIDLGNLLGTISPSQTTLLIGGKDKYMIRRGYISVAVDVRGTGMSSGETHLIGADEQADYADAVNWIKQQPWFNGNLGLAGTSYLGISSLLTAAQGDPAVKAVFAEVPMGDAYRGTAVPGGMLNANFINLWLSLTQNLSVSNGPAELAHPQYADQIKAANQDHIDAIDDWYLPTIDNALDNQTGYATDDGNFWKARSPVETAHKIKVPTFIIGGSNDIFQRGEPLLYEQLKHNVNTKLLIVPGAHVEAILDAIFNHDNSTNHGAPGSEALLLRWFDQYLKGMDNHNRSIPNVTQYVEGYGLFGTQRYTTSTDWPNPQVSPKRYYLRGNMKLSTSKPWWPERSHNIYEPEAPGVSIQKSSDGKRLMGQVTINDGSDCSSSAVQWSLGIDGLLPRPCYDNNDKVENSQNALVFQTGTLWSKMYINGPMEADIWMSATNPQAALTVRVSDVGPFGKATPISTGIQSAVYRKTDKSRSRYIDGTMIQPWHPFTAASREPLQPGQPVLVRVEIFPAAALLRFGHRLRISISSSNQVEGIWPLPEQAQANGNVTTIYNDPKHPSSVVIPFVPTSQLN